MFALFFDSSLGERESQAAPEHETAIRDKQAKDLAGLETFLYIIIVSVVLVFIFVAVMGVRISLSYNAEHKGVALPLTEKQAAAVDQKFGGSGSDQATEKLRKTKERRKKQKEKSAAATKNRLQKLREE